MSDNKNSNHGEILGDPKIHHDVAQTGHKERVGHVVEHGATTAPNAGTADPTDGRKQYEWESKYPPEARKIIHREAIYMVLVFIFSLLVIFVSWKGAFADILNITGRPATVLRKYCYYAGGGSLGGAIFSIKFLYRVVGRGYWHLDRQMWRYLSPLVSLGVAFAIGALIEASMFAGHAPRSSAAIVGTGFLIGYFADQAIAKMFEVATVLFGSTGKSSEGK